MMRHLTLLALTLASAGCVATDAQILEILRAIEPDATCAVASTNPLVGYGSYDAKLDQTAYRLNLVLRNNLEARTDDLQKLGETNVREHTNNIELVGFEGCWFQYAGKNTGFNAYDQGQIVDCKTLPAQSGSIPASAELDEGGTTETLVQVNVLDPPQLQQIFGSELNFNSIPRVGSYASSDDGDSATSSTDKFYSFLLQSPADTASRSPSWGANWPQTLQATVVVQLRAVGRLQGGTTVRSNYFPFMIYVCPSCVEASCGPLKSKTCIGPCPDGTACVSGMCGTAACPVTQEFSGHRPAYTGQAACLPAQGYYPPDCTTIVEGC